MQAWFWLSVITLIFFGMTGVTQKLSTNNISFEMSFVWFCLAVCVVSAAIAVLLPLDWRSLNLSLVALAALGGLLNGLGALTSFAALKQGGKASVVISDHQFISTSYDSWCLAFSRRKANGYPDDRHCFCFGCGGFPLARNGISGLESGCA